MERESRARVICDYIAGMTDNYILDLHRKLMERSLSSNARLRCVRSRRGDLSAAPGNSYLLRPFLPLCPPRRFLYSLKTGYLFHFSSLASEL